MNYIKQLDGLRAIAVLLVIIWHWIPRNSFTENLHAGTLGVNIFFVLSGFLITKILLSNRHKAEEINSSKLNVLKNFYARRMLRIFPVYYLTIVLTIVLSHSLTLGITKNEILSNLTYTNNFFTYSTKIWPIASLHFWSLAVEEQFYLAWPLIMLFWPKKCLVPSIILFISIGLFSQLLTTDREFGHLPTNTCLDCFGVGGIVGFMVVYQPKYLRKIYRLLTFLSIAGFIILSFSWQFHFYITCTRFIHAIIAAWVINHILLYKDKRSLLVSILNNKVLVNIGKVSYGIYLYHILYIYTASDFWYKYVFDYYLPFINKQYEPWIFLIINFWILYLIAWLSWKFIEKPFLSLKHKFKYQELPKTIKMKLLEAS